MTYARSGQNVVIPIEAGQTLVVKELSGTASVTGSGAARESASAIGAGFYVYGPQGSAGTLTLTTTGECDWYIVTGDATPSALSGSGAPAGVYNFKRGNTAQIRGAMIGALAGDLRSRMVFAADSMFAGTGSTNNGTVNARSKSWPRQLAAMLSAAGYTAYDTWACGQGAVPSSLATFLAYDPRVAFGSAASFNSTWPGIAGDNWHTGTDTTNGWIELTPGGTFDTLDVLYGRASGTGAFRVTNQDGTVINASFSTTNGTNGAAVSTFTFPAGSTKARITAASGFSLIGGMGVRNAAANGVEIVNCGISGVETSFFAAAGGNDWAAHRPSIAALFGSSTRNIYVLSGGYNDIHIGGASIATVQSRMRSRINHLNGLTNKPDVVVIDYPKLGSITQAQQDDLNGAIRAVAAEFDLPLIAQSEVTEDAATAVSMGLMTTDNLHNRAAGHAVTAKLFMSALQYAAALPA